MHAYKLNMINTTNIKLMKAKYLMAIICCGTFLFTNCVKQSIDFENPKIIQTDSMEFRYGLFDLNVAEGTLTPKTSFVFGEKLGVMYSITNLSSDTIIFRDADDQDAGKCYDINGNYIDIMSSFNFHEHNLRPNGVFDKYHRLPPKQTWSTNCVHSVETTTGTYYYQTPERTIVKPSGKDSVDIPCQPNIKVYFSIL